MHTPRWIPLILLTIFLGSGSRAYGQELPADAARVVSDFEREAMAVRKKVEAELRPVRKKAIQRLQALQDKYCREARLDEAVAIRDRIKELRGIQPDPGNLRVEPDDIGETLHFEVIGSTQGAIWGSEVYTSDSHLATAAVHAGVLSPGQKGIVTVRVLPGQKSYRGSSANSVASRDWGAWRVSFTVEKARI